MIQGLNAALSGLRAYTSQTRTTADNLANLNTTGYKASRSVQAASGAQGGVSTSSTQTIHTQGAVISKGGAFDMAITGNGFFKVKTASGATGFTRSGAFKMDNQRRLSDSNGNTLDPKIEIPSGATDVAVGKDGSISASINRKRQNIGQIELISFNNPGGLQRGGDNVYYETAASGQSVSGTPGTGEFGEIYPNSLKLSNVDLAEHTVNLIQSEHGFKAQIKTIQASDEMLGSILDIKT